MRVRVAAAAVACSLLGVASGPSLAGGVIDVVVENRSVIRGTLDRPQELESFRVHAPADVELTLVAKGVRTSVDVVVRNAAGNELSLPGLRRTRAGAKLVKGRLGAEGDTQVDVRLRSGAPPGDYQIYVAYTVPKRQGVSGDVTDGYAFVPIRAEGGSVANLDVRTKVRGEAVRWDRITGPNGFEFTVVPPATAASRHKLPGVQFPWTGEYQAYVASSPDLAVVAKAVVKQPKDGATVDVREDVVGGRRLVSRRVASLEASEVVPELDTDQLVAVDASGVGIALPGNAFPYPTTASIASADDIADPLEFEPSGAAVGIDVGGLQPSEAVTLTVPFDVGAFPLGTEPLCVLHQKDDGTVFEIPRGDVTVDRASGTVSFPTSSLSRFQVFRPPVELAQAAEVNIPTDIATGADGSVYVATAFHVSPSDPTRFGNAILRLRPEDGTLELFAGLGSSADGVPHRLDMDFDRDAKSGDQFGFVRSLAAPSFGGLLVLMVTGDLQSSILYYVFPEPDGTVLRVAGDGTSDFFEGGVAPFMGLPSCGGAAQFPNGDLALVTSGARWPESARVLYLSLQDFTIETVAGGGTFDGPGLDPLATRLAAPESILVDSQGRVLVGDLDWIVRFDLVNRTTQTLAGTKSILPNFDGSLSLEGRLLGGAGAPLRTVVMGQVGSIVFHPGSEEILYAADAFAGIVWRLDLVRDRAFIAAGRRLSVEQSLSTRNPPDRTDPVPPSSEIRFPISAEPVGEELYVLETFGNRLLVVRPKSQ